MPWTALLPLLFAAPGYLLQPPGRFHDGEPVVADGEAVLALHVDGDRARLQPARIILRRVDDPLHSPDGLDTGWQVGPDEDGSGPLVYLQGAGLSAGDVVRARVDAADGPSWSFAQPGQVDLVFGGARYRLVAACTGDADAPRSQAPSLDCRIDLHAPDGRRSRLATMHGYAMPDGQSYLGSDAPAALLFAGDLDRDGRLDLLFDVSDHYNVRRPALFLSGAAGEEDGPVREVARHEAVGC